MPAKSSLQDDTYYKVTVQRAVKVVGTMYWRPGEDIQSTGKLIKELDALPENAGAIDDNLTEIVQPEA